MTISRKARQESPEAREARLAKRRKSVFDLSNSAFSRRYGTARAGSHAGHSGRVESFAIAYRHKLAKDGRDVPDDIIGDREFRRLIVALHSEDPSEYQYGGSVHRAREQLGVIRGNEHYPPTGDR